MTKNKGFTYYELLIVVSIMALMVGFTTISITTFYRNNVYRSAENVETAVKSARNNAITRGTDHGWVNFYYNNRTLYAYVGDKISPSNPMDYNTQKWEKVAINCETVMIDGVHLTNNSYSSLNFKQSTGGFNGVEFTMGAAPHLTHAATNIVLESKNSTARISVSLFGNVKVD